MKKVEYEVKNLDCAGCAGKIQHKAGTMAGVLNANLDLYKKRFTLETDENYEEELFLHEINFFADSIEPGTQILKIEEYDEEEEIKRKLQEREEEERREKREKVTIIIGTILFIVAIISGNISLQIRLILSIIAYIILGWDVVLKSFKNITKGNFMDEKELLKTAQIGELYSNHPIGKAILSQLSEEIDENYIEGYKELSGFGVVAYYEGKEITKNISALPNQRLKFPNTSGNKIPTTTAEITTIGV
jgi:cation transport ATPase